jgi:hypothetical protein
MATWCHPPGTLGPIRAPQFVKMSCRFDYQPDMCKDYKAREHDQCASSSS